MTEDAKKRMGDAAKQYLASFNGKYGGLALSIAGQDFFAGYQSGYNDPDRAKIVATKSGSHIMVAKELWEQERNANKELLDIAETLDLYSTHAFFCVERRKSLDECLCGLNNVRQKLKAARGEK